MSTTAHAPAAAAADFVGPGPEPEPAIAGEAPAAIAASMTAPDLADLMASFNEVTQRLEATHHQLRGEVERLSAELRSTSAQLERAERLAALGEMAAGIAHEMRNPLACIGLYARMLEQDLDPAAAATDRSEALGTARKISVAVRRLDAIVGDVLTFAKDLSPRPEPTAARRLLADAWETVAAETVRGSASPPRLIMRCPEEVELAADPTLTHQALVNIMTNAVQAMADAGDDRTPASEPTVTVSARAARLRQASGPGRGAVAISIADTGPGVPPEVARRMFNPFFTTRNTGTGLGLAIVHRIVDAHGGTVTVENRPPAEGRGAVVTLTLPAETAEPAPEIVITPPALTATAFAKEHAA